MDATVTNIQEKSDVELKKLWEAGVRHLYLGIESGLPDVLEWMHKDHTLEEKEITSVMNKILNGLSSMGIELRA